MPTLGFLSDSLHPAVQWTLAAAALVAWIVSLALARRRGRPAAVALRALIRVVLGTFAFAALAGALRATPGLSLATNWPLWVPALLAAGGSELALALYAAERRTISPRAGRVLATLRILVILGVVGLMLRPVLNLEWEQTVRRQVAVLVDDSDSMRIMDTDMAPARQLRLAEVLPPDGEVPARPYRLETVEPALARLASELQTEVDWLGTLGSLPPETARRRMADRAPEMKQVLGDVAARAEQQKEAVSAPLTGELPLGEPTRDALEALSATIEERIIAPLGEAANAVDAGDHYALLASLPTIATALEETARRTGRLADDVDLTFYDTLTQDVRDRLEENARRTRLDVADALLGEPAGEAGILPELAADYRVRLYRFAADARELGGGEPGADTAVQGLTDFTAALKKVTMDIAADDLAGVLFLTDGRHNGPTSPEAVSRKLAAGGVPISTVLVAATTPPCDAAVIGIDAPETAASGDRLYVGADVKLDGLEGRTADVYLLLDDTVVDTVKLDVPADAMRTRVELSHVPEGDGVVRYTVAVQRFENEVLSGNNEYPLPVRVSDERTKLLIVEERPRWEFRYLKNLFAARDRAVKLQWILLHPETIGGQPPAPTVVASAGNPADQARATKLPAEDDEWLRFDVVVLGDIPPDTLAGGDMDALNRFVVDRGGTLVVVAGPAHMPHGFARTRLQELLPVDFRADPGYLSAPEESYRIALTAAGQRSVMLRLEATPEANDAAWEQVPEIYWRHPGTTARPTAQVLAWARTDADDADTDVRQRALITTQNVGLGRVVFLSFDRTWRLRSKHGDRYHYKFWGQLLRWAVRGELPAGTEHVRLGTDQTRYALHAPVTVTARLLNTDRTPVADAQVAAVVSRDGQAVLRRRLEYRSDQPGVYSADIGELPPGDYSVELQGPDVERILAEETQTTVETSFSVEPSASAEQVNLSGDAAVPSALARTTGGVVVAPAAWAQAIESMRAGDVTVTNRLEVPLSSAWPVLAVLCALAATEWIIRKRTGLP